VLRAANFFKETPNIQKIETNRIGSLLGAGRIRAWNFQLHKWVIKTK
jgi:hypothetical protein